VVAIGARHLRNRRGGTVDAVEHGEPVEYLPVSITLAPGEPISERLQHPEQRHKRGVVRPAARELKTRPPVGNRLPDGPQVRPRVAEGLDELRELLVAGAGDFGAQRERGTTG
jgi:antitoxin (DNA-binding transcriptional repressor) of toxin-antitoxin stability system